MGSVKQMQAYCYDDLLRAWPSTGCRAVFKQQPEDFVVTETLPFELEGEGEHDWLYIEKRNSNTDWVARKLADFAGVKLRQVSYAGLKDRHALCRQWFSVHLPGQASPDWHGVNDEEITLLQHTRHRRKLQRGALKQNRFEIRLRDIDGDVDALLQRCALLQREGAPNYFGEQRFGRNLDNLLRAEQLFTNPPRRLPRHKRSLYLSAARSWIFNCIVSQRIADGNWNRRLSGDVFMLNGSNACFADDNDAALRQRLADGEIHPTATLWGDGDSMAQADCLALEQAAAAQHAVLADGLIAARLEPQRRATRLLPLDFSWLHETDGNSLLLAFSLPSGAYATSILRELGDITQPTRANVPQPG